MRRSARRPASSVAATVAALKAFIENVIPVDMKISSCGGDAGCTCAVTHSKLSMRPKLKTDIYSIRC
jgi:hypothetical protein